MCSDSKANQHAPSTKLGKLVRGGRWFSAELMPENHLQQLVGAFREEAKDTANKKSISFW